MNERIVPHRVSGNSSQTLRHWGLLFIAAGIVGRSIIQNRMLDMMNLTADEVLAVMDGSNMGFALATSAILLQVVTCCAIPLFAFLLVEGAKRTASFPKYLLRIAALALVTEIPYDLAMYDKVFYWDNQNPVFGLLLGLVMIYFFKTYGGKRLKTFFVALLVIVVSICWSDMLRIDDGLVQILIIPILWFTRGNRRMQLYIGAIAMCFSVVLPTGDLGSIGSLKYLAAPLSFLFVFRYNEEPGEGNRLINYAAYPVMLFGIWLLGKFAF